MNLHIIRKYGISTIESRLGTYRLKMYYGCERTLSINYINANISADVDPEAIGNYILSIQADIKTLNNDDEFNCKFGYLTFLRGKCKNRIISYITYTYA